VARTYAYLNTGENAYVTLGHVGITLYIYSGNRTVGTPYVTKSGIRWLPKRNWTVRKGKRVVGASISWEELNEIAAKFEG
jgi:hypothetical protein